MFKAILDFKTDKLHENSSKQDFRYTPFTMTLHDAKLTTDANPTLFVKQEPLQETSVQSNAASKKSH